MSKITLITGGARSGKSQRVLQICEQYEKKVFVATAQAVDDEMSSRIQKHKKERGADWTTIEAPVDLASAIKKVDGENPVVVVDCLTVWVGNLLHHLKNEEQIENAISRFLRVLDDPTADIVLVTNEVGFGIVPANSEARAYRDILGSLNQRVAKRADSVQLMVCGIPMSIKE